MYRPSKNRAVHLVSVSLLRGWGLNLVIIVEVEVGTGKKEIVVEEFIVEICVLELNLFKLVARVSCRRVCRWELKLIATCLTIL